MGIPLLPHDNCLDYLSPLGQAINSFSPFFSFVTSSSLKIPPSVHLHLASCLSFMLLCVLCQGKVSSSSHCIFLFSLPSLSILLVNLGMFPVFSFWLANLRNLRISIFVVKGMNLPSKNRTLPLSNFWCCNSGCLPFVIFFLFFPCAVQLSHSLA